MTSDIESIELFGEPVRRRWWLLCKALECAPLDRAIDLAGAADAFVTGCATETQPSDVHVVSTPGDVDQVREIAAQPKPGSDTAPVLSAPVSPKRPMLELSAEQRERLLERLATGAKNADLAHEFGLSAQQVQGIRMGSAREIARRRDQLVSRQQHSSDSAQVVQSLDEIIRYLRQQDDVVVPQATGEFLVNGRFRLQVAELVSRANRMRTRQGKPEFNFVNGSPSKQTTLPASKSHPIFWEDRSAAHSNTKPVSSF